MKNKLIAALILFASLFLVILPVLALLGLHRKIVPLTLVDSLDARGRSNGTWIKVRFGIDFYQSTVEHEYEHIRQRWLTNIFGYGLLKKFSRRYREWVPASAYAASVKAGRPLDDCASSAAQYFGGDALKARKAILNQL